MSTCSVAATFVVWAFLQLLGKFPPTLAHPGWEMQYSSDHRLGQAELFRSASFKSALFKYSEHP